MTIRLPFQSTSFEPSLSRQFSNLRNVELRSINLRPIHYIGIALLASGIAGALLTRWYSKRSQRGRSVASTHRPESINRWESEGGAVPISPTNTAAQVTPKTPAEIDAAGHAL
jgi:hypothetical protein